MEILNCVMFIASLQMFVSATENYYNYSELCLFLKGHTPKRLGTTNLSL